jgi:hypothetical protein
MSDGIEMDMGMNKDSGNNSMQIGDREMNRYRRGPALNEESCPEVTKIGLGDPEKYNRLFPLNQRNQ